MMIGKALICDTRTYASESVNTRDKFIHGLQAYGLEKTPSWENDSFPSQARQTILPNLERISIIHRLSGSKETENEVSP